MRTRAVMLVGVAAALSLGGPEARAQRLDEGTLVIREGRREIGRETFSVLEGRGRGLPGSTLVSQADYPARAPAASRTLLLTRDTLGHLTGLEVGTFTMPDTSRLVGDLQRDRLTIRIIQGTRESARQFPAGPDLLILPDSLFAAYAQFGALATPEGRSLSVLEPATGRRSRVTVTLLPGGGPSGGRELALSGDITARVSFDGEGHLMEVDLPQAGLRARRLGR